MTERAALPTGAGFRFSTEGMTPRAAFDLYHSVFAAGAEARRESERFKATLTARPFVRMVIHERWLHDVRHVREAPQVRRTDFSHLTLTLCLAGRVTGRSGDAALAIGPGEMLLLDLRYPATLLMSAAHVLTVAVAREVVEAAVGDATRFHARVFDAAATAPLLRYLSDLLRAPGPPPPAAPPPYQMVSDHLAAMVSDAADRPARRLKGQRLLLAHGAIEAGLDDPDFGAGTLARQLGISRASLYRLFEPLGGVDRHLTARRIGRLTRMLADPGEHASFATLVERAGWASESHASRVFLERIGERPGAFRRRFGTLSAAELAAVTMRSWSNELR